ncbi:DUF4178 domain-containing protein [Microvirga sp. STR05]|uniref:DUF4178 domain-containing protein n=1 Tax=Hymenobacter duratus TaxID=2771356 RepID=A0ABR8JF12_9BACT|nr:DUF4178 domain-containing protein [Hymenobacter duratus]MBD2715448.1 DUF4178 domain-containing protein [Hymenobacter duratus]MBR7950356.1 DUF4178 domain-containing protein [Microvirga sp. STR05]
MSSLLATPAAPAHVPCPRCRHEVPYFDQLNSVFFVCPACHAYFKAEDNTALVMLGKFAGDQKPVLHPGALGTLRGQQYRVMGFMLRKEKEASYQWHEYMLRHEETDIYAQLAMYDGHWMLVGPAGRDYTVSGQATSPGATILDEDTTYDIYNSYSPDILFAEGEFDWDIREDSKLTVTEYIAPPYMLVREKQGHQAAQWYKGLHLEPSEIAEGFQVPNQRMPFRTGVGAIQPAPAENWPALRSFSLSMALLVIITQLALLFIKPEKRVLRQEFSTGRETVPTGASVEALAAGSNRVLVSKSFDIEGPAALQFELTSSLANQWLEVPVTLVNERTGQSYEFTKSLEFYSGVEGGESWREGSQDQEATLANIPTGKYHLTLYPVTENGQDLPLRLGVSQHTPLQSNAVVLLLLLAVYPVIQYLRRYSHEHTRWANSSYGPQDES